MFIYTTEYHKRFGLIPVPPKMLSLMEQNSTHPCSSIDICLGLMHDLRETFRIHWTRMDVWRMALGFQLTINALISFMCLEMDIQSFGLTSIISTLVTILLDYFEYTILAFLPLLFVSYRLSALWINHRCRITNFGSVISALLLCIAILASCSNSFVIQEARVLSFLLQSLLMSFSIYTVC